MWSKEVIPDSSSVLLRVHKSLIPDGEVRPNVFRDQGAGMSVDWREYSTALETEIEARFPLTMRSSACRQAVSAKSRDSLWNTIRFRRIRSTRMEILSDPTGRTLKSLAKRQLNAA